MPAAESASPKLLDRIARNVAAVLAASNRRPGPHFRMQGREVFRFAVENLARQARAVTAAAGVGLDGVDLFIPHQANRRIIEAAARRVGMPLDKVFVNIERYGNTSTASIPIALHEALANGRIQAGDRVLMASFGAGLTWGSCLLEWEQPALPAPPKASPAGAGP